MYDRISQGKPGMKPEYELKLVIKFLIDLEWFIGIRINKKKNKRKHKIGNKRKRKGKKDPSLTSIIFDSLFAFLDFFFFIKPKSDIKFLFNFFLSFFLLSPNRALRVLYKYKLSLR